MALMSLFATLLGLVSVAVARRHSLYLEDDNRFIIDLSSFAYNEQGSLNVTFHKLKLDAKQIESLIATKDPQYEEMSTGVGQIGFILEKLNSRGAVKYQKDPTSFPSTALRCSLHEPKNGTRHVIIAKMGAEFEDYALTLTYPSLIEKGITLKVTDLFKPENVDPVDEDENRRKRRDDDETTHSRGVNTDNKDVSNGLLSTTVSQQHIFEWTFSLAWTFDESAVGLYELTFHNCFNREKDILDISELKMDLIEMNGEHYLSTGEMPLPMVYGFVSVLFFIATFMWLIVLRQQDTVVYKIHYLMLFLVFFKALSVMFHAIDFHFLDSEGKTDAWTIIFYIVHLLKGGILIVTLTLIGTGWAFIKYVLSEREKRLFAIVVPLQIFVNIAFIIFKETEEGQKEYTSWSHVMILLDLLCYALILWPVYWSIKHLQQSSLTDGKAARSLEKLDLFRHFYIMFVLYIYFTRIVVYIMKITLPPNETWVANFCDETATLGFFILTGYKFRPGCNNPYFKVEEEMSEVLTKSNLTENVKKRDRGEKQKLLAESDEDEDTILDTNTIVVA